MRLKDFKVLTFDCYGTLINWESGMLAALKPLYDRLPRRPSDNEILTTYGEVEVRQQRTTPTMPYNKLLAVVYKRLAEQWGLSASWQEALDFGASIQAWPPFPDSKEALRYLKQHYRLVILSNVDNESFEASRRHLGIEFDAILTAEDIGSYKPDPRNFSYMIEQLAKMGIRKEEILHTAESLFHDHVPANEMGLKSAWIYRRHDKEGFGATRAPEKMPRIDFRFTSLGKMAEAHRLEEA